MQEAPAVCNGEEWRPVVGWEADYEVSNRGRVRSLRRKRPYRVGRILSPFRRAGYPTVTLCRGTQHSKTVHALVAAAFLGPRPPGLEVNHIDGDRRNSRADNLEYVTSSQNKLHTFRLGNKPVGSAHHAAVLDEGRVRRIKELLLTERPSAVARECGVNISTLYTIIRGKSWRHVEP